MQDQSNRNTLIFVVCAIVLLFGYQFLVIEPQSKKHQAELARQQATVTAQQALAKAVPNAMGSFVSRAAAVAASPRVAIATPALAGSVALRGARVAAVTTLRRDEVRASAGDAGASRSLRTERRVVRGAAPP